MVVSGLHGNDSAAVSLGGRPHGSFSLCDFCHLSEAPFSLGGIPEALFYLKWVHTMTLVYIIILTLGGKIPSAQIPTCMKEPAISAPEWVSHHLPPPRHHKMVTVSRQGRQYGSVRAPCRPCAAPSSLALSLIICIMTALDQVVSYGFFQLWSFTILWHPQDYK